MKPKLKYEVRYAGSDWKFSEECGLGQPECDVAVFPVTDGVWYATFQFFDYNYTYDVNSTGSGYVDGTESIYFEFEEANGDDEDGSGVVEVAFHIPDGCHFFGGWGKRTYHCTIYEYSAYERIVGD